MTRRDVGRARNRALGTMLMLCALAALGACETQNGARQVVPTPDAPRDADQPIQTLRLPGGLTMEVLHLGDGEPTCEQCFVEVRYVGKLEDGSVFDSTIGESSPRRFFLPRLIEGWRLGLAGLRVGSRVRLTIPSDLAYGPEGMPELGVPPNATLTYEIRLDRVVTPIELGSGGPH